jgi:hypothetical protein
MPNEYVHYIKRRVITRYPTDAADPWFSELQTYEDGFEVPVYHVTRSSAWPVREIQPNDIIWLVSQLSSPWGTLPPSIDARIEVKSIEENIAQSTTLRFLASSSSSWFPLVDASEMLSRISEASRNGTITFPYSKMKNNISQAFQGIKKIDSTTLINEWAFAVQAQEFDFISYRIIDGSKHAFSKVQTLMKEKKSVFWDRWSLPRRLAERRELVSDDALDSLLVKKMRQARTIWGIESPRYNEVKSYSAKEKKLALEIGRYQTATQTS